MSNYTKATNFATKDTLPTGDSGKIVKGTEIDSEFNSIASAVSSKADIASPTFTGTPAAPTAASGANTTQLATTAFVKAAVDTLDALKTDKTLTITAGTGLTGGGALSANRTIAVATTGVTAATYGSTTKVPVLAVNAQGQITSASEVTLVPAWNVTYSNTTVSPGSDFTIPANTIVVFGYAFSTNNVVNNTLSSIRIKNGATTLTDINIGFTVSANNGNGYTGHLPFSVPISSAATTLTNNIVTGSGVTFYITGYVTKA